jgi:predicted DNA-binding transcriptional regulator AlpA
VVARQVPVDQLVGANEIAERLGVGKSTVVHDWRRRHPEFPEPVAKLKTALVWDWAEVEAWARATGRLK